MASSVPARALERLVTELEACFDTEIALARAQGRREIAEQLNQAARRLGESGDFTSTAAVLVDASPGICNGAAIFRIVSNTAEGERVRGVDTRKSEAFKTLRIPLTEAPALAQAVQTGDPVAAAGASGEISPRLAEFFGHTAGERVEIVPISGKDGVAGLLYAWGTAEPAALELLAQSASLAMRAAAPTAPPPELVSIEPPAAQPVQVVVKEAAALSPPLELKARRFARVEVAELRLYQPEAVRAGRARNDLYGALRESIDQARAVYRRAFLSSGAKMADYFHEELLHTLANDDPGMLGKEYPGPLA